MFGFRYIKTQPTQYVVAHKSGKITKEGTGISLIYYAPATTISIIPLSSKNDNFIFELSCLDFQQVTIQGQVSYRILEPKKTMTLINFALKDNAKGYVSDEPEKLSKKVSNVAEGLIQKAVQKMVLKDVLLANGELSVIVTKELNEHPEIQSLGLAIISVSILAIRPQPETARALEAEAREAILRVADEAIFLRRNSAVENERAIRENELDTEIAVEQKKRNIRETQIEAEASIQIKQQEIERAKLAAEIELENQRKEYVSCKANNIKTMAEAEAHRMGALVEALRLADPKMIQALAASGMQPAQLIAQAFTGIADKAEKIGQLNLSPELLQSLMNQGKK